MSSGDEQYRVLFRGGNGPEQLSDPESRGDAEHTARELTRKGYAVGSVMEASAAEAYMRDRYSPTYRGVTVPGDLRADGAPRRVYEAWKRGVDSLLDGTEPAPAVSEHKDWQWIIKIHWDAEHTSPAVGPFGQTEADNKMRELRRRFREAGLKPLKMTCELLRVPDALDGWVQDRIDEARLRADDGGEG